MNVNQNEIMGLPKEVVELSKSKEVVVDGNILLAIAEVAENLDMLKRILDLIVGEKIDKVIITSATYSEIEGLKKSQAKGTTASKVYSWIGKVLYDGNETYEYVELPKHPDGVDDALIDFTIERKADFISLDTRCNIRYFKKANISPKMRLDEEKLTNLIKLVKHLDNLKEENLSEYLQKIFDSKKANIVEFIQMNSKERLNTILTILVENCFDIEDEKFIEEIKKTVLKTKTGEISNKVLLKSLSKLKGYNLGDLSVEESLLEEHSSLVEKFLKEKGFDSFRELQKAQPFLTEDELVKGILRYYEVVGNGGKI